ncbi:MAG: hypothetical protein KatS3mg031_1390 [Chitinophagales bacterium]|nr:MAG: hypothetical protein KatS3mg031_1390 [Chitinophagales bacterium]
MTGKQKENLCSGFAPVTPAQWKQKIIQELKGRPYDELIWHSEEGFEIKPFYTAEDLEEVHLPDFTSKEAGWEIQQDITVKNTKEANRKAKEALAGGAESIGLLLAGRCPSANSLHHLLNDIATGDHPLHFSGIPLQCADQLLSVIPGKISGSVAFQDMQPQHLPELISRSKHFPAICLLTFHLTDVLQFFPIPRTSGNKIRLVVSLSADFFSEIARLRALRALFSEKHIPLHLHAEYRPQKIASGEEHYAILRATTSAMAAIAGGCDSLSLHAHPLAGKSNASSERIFRNIQLILKYESHFDNLTDVAAGSYYLELLTQKFYDFFTSQIKFQ